MAQSKKSSKKGIFSMLLVTIFFIAGICLVTYPSFSDWWNNIHQLRAIADYAETIGSYKAEDLSKLLTDASDYNKTLVNDITRFHFNESKYSVYESLLNVDGSGIMGYLEIPSIDVALPIYHGTKDAVLQVAVGHVEGSSLPVGGEGTHAVLSGHCGLPSAKLFTNLDKVSVGDTFRLSVLNETLTYEVDQIEIVLPEDMALLAIDPDQDYVTLVTCTPYGINSHRLLVRGSRIETNEKENNDNSQPTVTQTSVTTVQTPNMPIEVIVAACAIVAVLIYLFIEIFKKGERKNA